MPYTLNPFTKKLDFWKTSLVPGGDVSSLTGNTGGSVGPDGSGNINVIGSGDVTVTGNPGTNTLTITTTGSHLPYTSVTTTPYTVLASDSFIGVNTSTLAITLVFPAPGNTGKIYYIKDDTGGASVHNITLSASSIDGSTTLVINQNDGSIGLYDNGSMYLAFAAYDFNPNYVPLSGAVMFNGSTLSVPEIFTDEVASRTASTDLLVNATGGNILLHPKSGSSVQANSSVSCYGFQLQPPTGDAQAFITSTAANTYATLTLTRKTAAVAGSYVSHAENGTEIWFSGMVNGDSNFHIFNESNNTSILQLTSAGVMTLASNTANANLIIAASTANAYSYIILNRPTAANGSVRIAPGSKHGKMGFRNDQWRFSIPYFECSNFI